MGWPRMGGDPWGGGSLRWAEGSVAGAAWAGQPQWTELANAPPSAGHRPAQGERKALQEIGQLAQEAAVMALMTLLRAPVTAGPASAHTCLSCHSGPALGPL